LMGSFCARINPDTIIIKKNKTVFLIF